MDLDNRSAGIVGGGTVRNRVGDVHYLSTGEEVGGARGFSLQYIDVSQGLSTAVVFVQIESPKGGILNAEEKRPDVQVAIAAAIAEASGVPFSLVGWELEPLASLDYPAKVRVIVEANGKSVTGRGEDVDTAVAFAKAFVDALNSIA